MGTELAIGAAAFLASSLVSYAVTPKSPSMDMTNYDMLRQTQQQADTESEAAKARIEEARKREELRTQQMYGKDIMTSEVGADVDKVGIKNQVLGNKDDTEEGSSEVV